MMRELQRKYNRAGGDAGGGAPPQGRGGGGGLMALGGSVFRSASDMCCFNMPAQ